MSDVSEFQRFLIFYGDVIYNFVNNLVLENDDISTTV